MKRGFSTVEIMMAMAILVIVLSAVVVTSFGNQSILVGSQTNAEAINKAQDLLEQEQAYARKDFNLVVATSSSDGIYTKNVTVEQTDVLTKKVTATISWKDESNQTRNTSLRIIVTNFNNAIGGDTCSSVLSSENGWQQAKISSSIALSGLSGLPNSTYAIGGMEAYKGYLYVAIAKTGNNNDPTLLVFDISNPQNPVLKGAYDDSASTITGLSTLRVAEDLTSSSGKIYTYATSGRSISSAKDFGQLQVIDVSNPSSYPNWQPATTSLKMAGLSGSGGVGNAIFYINSYLYLGLTTNAGEFRIIDTHIPLSPVEVGKWPTSGSIGHDVNSILVKDGYAYIAHPTDSTQQQDLTVLDVTDPTTPKSLSNGYYFRSGDLNQNGKSLYAVGDTLYYGATVSSSVANPPEFYVLNITSPQNLSTNNASPVTAQLPSSVDGLLIRNDIAFVLTKTELRLYRINQYSNPWTLVLTKSIPLPSSGSTYEPSIACENDTVYISSNANGSDAGTISVITPGP